MRDITLDFNGSPLPLRLTAGALFDIYDRFGVRDSVLQASGALHNTEMGRIALCRLAALLADQAELWRRRQGYTPQYCPEPGYFTKVSREKLLKAVRQAVETGFARSVSGTEDEGEVNLILAARNDEAAESAERLRVGFLTVCAVRLHLAPADAMLLTPGEYLDMVTLLGGKEDEYGSPNNFN